MHERDTPARSRPFGEDILEGMDDFWRSRAGVPRSRGVLAARPGEPPLEAAAAGDAASGDAPIRMARLAPSRELTDLVRHYWIPRWRLPAGRAVTQRVLEYPSANLVVARDTVAVHGPSIGLGERTLDGAGWAFGVLLQPGTARALLGREPRELVGRAMTLDGPGIHPPGIGTLREVIAVRVGDGDDPGAVTAFERWLSGLGLAVPDDARLVRELIARAEADRTLVRVEQLARLAGLGVRQLERVVREQLGLTPKWLIRRYRLQEAAERLSAARRPALAELATELGYADQAHFTREFAAVIGVPPGRYQREAEAARGTAPAREREPARATGGGA